MYVACQQHLPVVVSYLCTRSRVVNQSEHVSHAGTRWAPLADSPCLVSVVDGDAKDAPNDIING